jgi:hypothetical protein
MEAALRDLENPRGRSVAALEQAFGERRSEYEAAKDKLERREAVEEARRSMPDGVSPAVDSPEQATARRGLDRGSQGQIRRVGDGQYRLHATKDEFAAASSR